MGPCVVTWYRDLVYLSRPGIGTWYLDQESGPGMGPCVVTWYRDLVYLSRPGIGALYRGVVSGPVFFCDLRS